MRYGHQYTGSKTSRQDAREQADALRMQDGCIRAGTRWEPDNFAHPEQSAGRNHYAYAVFVDDPGEAPGLDGVRRVVLVGSDLRRAEEIDAHRAGRPMLA